MTIHKAEIVPWKPIATLYEQLKEVAPQKAIDPWTIATHRLLRQEDEDHTFLQQIGECHAWMAERIVKYLSPYSSMDWRKFPSHFLHTSPKALCWALTAYRIIHPLPVVAHSRPPWWQRLLLLYAPWMKKKVPQWVSNRPRTSAGHGGSSARSLVQIQFDRKALSADDPPGDLIIMHILAEVIVAKAADQLAIRNSGGKLKRKPGGFRSEGFLHTYPAILFTDRSDAHFWRNHVKTFVDASPLTRWVYFDLIECQTVPVLNPIYDRCGALWLSQLAHSFVGAMLSPPPAHEHFCFIASKVMELESEVKDIEETERLLNPINLFQHKGTLRKVRETLDQARKEREQQVNLLRSQPATRLKFLAQCFSSSTECPGPFILQILALNMFVRHLFALQTTVIKKFAKSTNRPLPARKYASLASQVMEPGGPVFSKFKDSICGASELAPGLEQQIRENDREISVDLNDLHHVFDPPVLSYFPDCNTDKAQNALATIGHRLNIAETEIARFINLFCKEDKKDQTYAVILPLKHEKQGDPPASILGSWVPAVRKTLPH